MADIKSAANNPPSLREEELRQGIEMLFYAYRDFTAEPDAMLARFGFGRAHHRVIYFVGRHPQMTVTENILTITVDLTKEFGPSSSGKTIIIASTEGNIAVPEREEKIGLNVYRKK